MELPPVKNPDSPRDLLRDLSDLYTDNVRRGRDIVYWNLLREGVLKNEDKVHWREDFAHYCYNLRYRGFYDDTNALEDDVEKLEEEEGEDTCDRLMKFLTLLSGSVPHQTGRTGLIPTIQPVEVRAHHVLPDVQNRYYGDTHASSAQSSGYLMYRDELFENVSSCPNIEQSEKMIGGFPDSSVAARFIRPAQHKLPPPTTTLTGLPAPEPTPRYQTLPLPAPPSAEQEYGSSQSILADLPALPPPTVTGIFKSLSHKSPEVGPVCTGPVLRASVKERYQPAQRNTVQRFAAVRPCQDLVAVSDSSGIDSDDHEAWEEAFRNMDKEFPTPTYELVGRKVKQERPYLTEAGPAVYSRLCVLLCSPYSDLDVVTEQHVLYQCQFVLIGIPTSIFQFDKTKVEFVPLQNICYTGVSPDSLVDCLYSIAYSGTLYLRLKMFCDQYSTVERYGNIVKGLVSAVEQYLNLHHAFLSQIPITSLIQLIWKTKDLTSQLEFLCNLLLLEEGLPTGTDLIEYLFQTAEILTASPYYKIMLALIRAAFTPYVKFLELWLCEGRVWDDWDEFNVSSHQEWMNNKDYLFWQYAYTEREEVRLPGFLEELREQLVNTGKLINLFRLCVPDHPLSISKIRPPQLQLTFNDRNINNNMKKWEDYRDSVERELNTQAVVREMKKKEEEEKRIAKLTEAKEDARRRIAMIMEEAGALRARATTNKKQEVQRLQEQMLERAEQRANMLETEKREDRERIERNQTEQYELVGRVRAQLEEYYTSLTAEKAREERRSLWRIQRMKLNRLRRAHLMLEMSNLNQELRKKLEGNSTAVREESYGSGRDPLALSQVVAKTDVNSESSVVPSETMSANEAASESETGTKSETVSKSETNSSSETVSTEARTRKTWDEPINVNINIAMDGSEKAVLKDVSVTGSPLLRRQDDGSLVGNNKNLGVDNGSNKNDVSTTNENINTTALTADVKSDNPQEKENLSDDDSEISFTLSPAEKLSLVRQSVTSEDMDFYSCKSESFDSDQPLLARLDSEGSEMKRLLYARPSHESIPEHHAESQYEPDGQMKEVLYGAAGEETSSSKTKQPLSRLDSEGDEMKNLLYSGAQKVEESKSKQTLSRLDSEGNEMRDLLYARSDSNKSEDTKTKPPVSRQGSEGGVMRDILYSAGGRSQSVASDDSRYTEALSRLDSRDMRDILHSVPETDGAEYDGAELGGAEYDGAEFDGAELDRAEFDPDKPLARLDSEGSEMKDILYSTSTTTTTSHTVVQYEPAGQMKDLLYGEDTTSGYSTMRQGESGSETGTLRTESSLSTVRGRRAEPFDRMKEILYGQPQTKLNDDSDVEFSQERSKISIGDDSGIEIDYQVQPIQLSYPELESKPNPNIMTERLTKYYVAEENVNEGEVEMYRTLDITLRRLLLQPLLLQSKLVNSAAVRYFVHELKINEHFDALRSYLCMNDGMFGDSLSKGIFKMIDSGVDITCSPARLNAVLHEALECSKINNRLSLESVGNQVSGGDVLNTLVLKYDVDWPSNVIITDNCLYKYNEIFKFLLKLKHGCFMLDKIWFLLASVDVKGGSSQMRRLQVCRYEVSQCLHAVQIYMTHQLHNISWHELQGELGGASSVSQLQLAHQTYLNNALERLLLGESTRAPHEIILKIFKHVTLFVKLLESAQFTTDLHGHVTHPHFEKIVQRHEDFTKQAVFILKVAESSNSSGYKPYIDEFMLRLDFNHYYQSSNPIVKRRSMAGLNLIHSGSKAKLTNSLSSPNTNLARSIG